MMPLCAMSGVLGWGHRTLAILKHCSEVSSFTAGYSFHSVAPHPVPSRAPVTRACSTAYAGKEKKQVVVIIIIIIKILNIVQPNGASAELCKWSEI